MRLPVAQKAALATRELVQLTHSLVVQVWSKFIT